MEVEVRVLGFVVVGLVFQILFIIDVVLSLDLLKVISASKCFSHCFEFAQLRFEEFHHASSHVFEAQLDHYFLVKSNQLILSEKSLYLDSSFEDFPHPLINHFIQPLLRTFVRIQHCASRSNSSQFFQ